MKREPISKETIVVANQEETAVYVTEAGYVAIRQRHELQDDSLVILAPANVDAVIKAMQNCIQEAIEARQEFLFGDDDAAT